MAKSETINYEWGIVRHFWRAAAKYPKHFWLIICIPISNIALGSLVPLFIGRMLASIHQSGNGLHYLPYLLAASLLAVITNRIGYGNLLILQAKVLADLQQESFASLLEKSVGFHNDRVAGKLISDASDYPNAFVQLSNAFMINILPLLVILLSGVILVGIYSWQLGLLILLMAIFTIGSGYLGTRGRTPLRIGRLKASKLVISHMADTISNHQAVKTFARDRDELATGKHLNQDLMNLRMKDWIQASHHNNGRISGLLVFQVLFVLLTLYLTKRNPALLGIGIFAFSYTVTLANRLIEINTTIRTVEDAFLQAGPMAEILNEKATVTDALGARPLILKQGLIDIRNVSFHYADANSAEQVFPDLSLTIAPGEKIGLVGPSGGGKSTLTRLLLRFEDIQTGSIEIDGQNIAAVTQRSLREHVGYVPQEPLLFHRSILENIAYGKPDATLEEVQSAAKKAYAYDFITKLPAAFDTIVGERGVKLSGGQRQRVAIARAILKNSPILILDEATSALDSESEKVIQEALWKLMEGKTAIVIAHRLSTIQRLDRIVVLDEGKIVEDGTHAELLKQKGLYAKLWSHQSGGFIEE